MSCNTKPRDFLRQIFGPLLQRCCCGIRLFSDGGVLLGHLIQLVNAGIYLDQPNRLFIGSQRNGRDLV